MQTLVVNGEPVVFGDSYGPGAFRHLANVVTGDEEREHESTRVRIQKLIQQSYEERNTRAERLPVQITGRVFKFVAPDCVEGIGGRRRRWSGPTVTVLKKDRWGNVYPREKEIRGCRCGDCDDVNLFTTYQFLREHTGVRFNI